MVAIVNARAVLPDKILQDAVILIKDKKIIEIGQNIDTKNADIIDVKGACVGPGFVDIHIHCDGGKYRRETNPKMVALTPARAIGVDDKAGSVEVGKNANLVFVDDELKLKKVMFEGELI